MQIYPSLQNGGKEGGKWGVDVCLVLLMLLCVSVPKSCTSADHYLFFFLHHLGLKISLHCVTNCCGISMSTAKREEETKTTENNHGRTLDLLAMFQSKRLKLPSRKLQSCNQCSHTPPLRHALFDSVLTSTS